MYFHATRLILSNQIIYGLENWTQEQGTQQFVELHAFFSTHTFSQLPDQYASHIVRHANHFPINYPWNEVKLFCPDIQLT